MFSSFRIPAGLLCLRTNGEVYCRHILKCRTLSQLLYVSPFNHCTIIFSARKPETNTANTIYRRRVLVSLAVTAPSDSRKTNDYSLYIITGARENGFVKTAVNEVDFLSLYEFDRHQRTRTHDGRFRGAGLTNRQIFFLPINRMSNFDRNNNKNKNRAVVINRVRHSQNHIRRFPRSAAAARPARYDRTTPNRQYYSCRTRLVLSILNCINYITIL